MELYLNNNLIENISVLEKVKFSRLLKLSLHNNKINDLRVFEKAKLNNLQELYLDGNNIDVNKYKYIITSLKKRIKDFCI
jgi:Leucine-rich repeat (LRR) protein